MIVIPATKSSAEVRIDQSAEGRWVYVYQGGEEAEPLILEKEQALLLARELLDFAIRGEGYRFRAAIPFEDREY